MEICDNSQSFSYFLSFLEFVFAQFRPSEFRFGMTERKIRRNLGAFLSFSVCLSSCTLKWNSMEKNLILAGDDTRFTPV